MLYVQNWFSLLLRYAMVAMMLATDGRCASEVQRQTKSMMKSFIVVTLLWMICFLKQSVDFCQICTIIVLFSILEQYSCYANHRCSYPACNLAYNFVMQTIDAAFLHVIQHKLAEIYLFMCKTPSRVNSKKMISNFCCHKHIESSCMIVLLRAAVILV